MRVLQALLLLFAWHEAAQAQTLAPPPELAAVPVVLLADMGSGQVLYARQPDLRFVPASVAKVMSAYTAIGLMRQGKLAAAREFTVDAATAQQWNGRGTSLYLRAGDRISAEMLLRAMTTVSANDAAVVLAQGYAGSIAGWAALMNGEARQLGMADSHFATPNGWPDGGQTWVTARDLAALGAALIARYPAEYRNYFGQRSLTWNGATQYNKDPVTGVVPGADGIKTGHTAEAGFNFLGSAERNGRRLVMVIAGARSEAERASASRALLEWGFWGWDRIALFRAGEPIGTAQVQQGSARKVGLVAPLPVYATLPKGETARVQLRVVYQGPLIAPIAKGSQIAHLEISRPGAEPSQVPLFAAESVAEAGWFDRLLNGLYRIFA